MKSINIKLNLFVLKSVVLPLILKSVVLPLIIFTAAFLFFYTNVGNLQAQEVNQARQQGWFVGVSPFVMDVKLKKTSRITGEERTEVSELVSEDVGATSYHATVPNFASDDRHMNQFAGGSSALAVANTAIAAAISLCKEGKTPTTDIEPTDRRGNIGVGRDTIYLINYATTDNFTGDLDGLRQLLIDTTPTTIDSGATGQAAAAPLCRAFFESALSPSDPMTNTSEDTTKLPDKTTEETSKLKGTGISFGFNFEKYSLSFNQLQWSAGDDKLQAQVLLARYFLPYGFSVGGGLASAKLDTSFGSASGTAPALHFGYNRAITKNLQIQVGLFWLGLDLAVQDTQIINSTPTTTPTTTTTLPLTTGATFQRRAIVGLVRVGGNNNENDYNAIQGFALSGNTNPYDTRIVVTATIPSKAITTTTTSTTKTVSEQHHQTAEIKNPATISINFIWRFR